MKLDWNSSDAALFDGPVGECTYGSRLLGADPALVLHGGGNTSVKADFADITGRVIEALFVKGSGWDLASIEVPGFTPLPLDRLGELLNLPTLSDPDMMRELSAARLDPGAPQPSVETLLHAYLPFPAIQHSHADAIISLTNNARGVEQVREVFGDDVIVVPYVMPGFDLAKKVVEIWSDQATASTAGMVLMNHGLFTFGSDTRTAYELHRSLIRRANDWLDVNAPLSTVDSTQPTPSCCCADIAHLRNRISTAAGRPMILSVHDDNASMRFVNRPDLASLATRGPLTPDHVIRTKMLPMVGVDLDQYVASYSDYFTEYSHRGRTELSMLDPTPRVVLDPSFGMITVGDTAKSAQICADIYSHTIPVLERTEDHLGGYEALDAHHLFDCEYWDLEQAKLKLAGPLPELAGTVSIVTGAASGIGKACAAELLNRGSAVVGLDISDSVGTTFSGPNWLGICVDVSDADAQASAIEAAVRSFGGIDIVVVAAGVFGASTPIANLASTDWDRVQTINVNSVANLFREVHPYLALSPVKGRVAIIGSKNVDAPGMGAAAYSASKAAVTQLGRVAALEWAADGIRVNNVHPDAVFDTGLWTDDLLAERANKYGLSIAEYKTRNLLKTEVTSINVAYVVAELCGDGFSATTGAHIPIDGGNERVI